jgi:hypothetical protein
VKLSWKEARPETEGKLFFSAEMLAQISVSPGLMRQVALLHFKVMQGELNRVTLRLHGAGEVTRVQGDQVLAWNLEPVPDSTDRRLVIQLNQPQKDQFSFQVQAQTPLGAFPQTADALRIASRKRHAAFPAFSHRQRRRGAAWKWRRPRHVANFAGTISRKRRDAGRCFAPPATSALPTVCRRGFRAAHSGRPDSARAVGVGSAGLSPRRKRIGD